MVWRYGSSASYPVLNTPVGRYISVMGGYEHSCAVSEYHVVTCWGSGTCSALTPPTGNNFEALGLGQSSYMTIARTQGTACYANCGGSTTPPYLTNNDFVCFANAYAANDLYADCDGSGVLTGNDFVCFANKFVTGCGM